MNKDKRVTANFGIESQVPRANQANLGPLAGAAIHVYSLKNLSSPIKGPFQTNNSAHRKKLSFDYKQLLSSKSFVSLVHTGADRDIFEKALDSVFGVHFQDS